MAICHNTLVLLFKENKSILCDNFTSTWSRTRLVLEKLVDARNSLTYFHGLFLYLYHLHLFKFSTHISIAELPPLNVIFPTVIKCHTLEYLSFPPFLQRFAHSEEMLWIWHIHKYTISFIIWKLYDYRVIYI